MRIACLFWIVSDTSIFLVARDLHLTYFFLFPPPYIPRISVFGTFIKHGSANGTSPLRILAQNLMDDHTSAGGQMYECTTSCMSVHAR